jgi:lysophospholipase L1-like esterase
MVKLSQSVGAAVLLSTPPSALPWYPPNATSQQSYWVYDARTTQAYRDELNRRLAKIAAEEQALHHDVRYIGAQLDTTAFLDDVHLKDQGNAALARIFIDAIQPFVTPEAPKRAVVHAGS